MTVTFLVNQEEVRVDNVLLQNSQLVKDVISQLAKDDISIPIAADYSVVINIYLEFVKVAHSPPLPVGQLPVINDVNQLLLCFFMESFFVDSSFLIYLIGQAHGLWKDFLPHIQRLPDERTIYLYSPYEFIPDDYRQKASFFDEWLALNDNKQVILNRDNSKIYYIQVSYHSNGQLRKVKAYHRTVNGKKRGYDYRIGWYSNGHLKFQGSCKEGKCHGFWKNWHSNRQLKFQGYYKNDKIDGMLEGWDNDGRPSYRKSYKMSKLMSEVHFSLVIT